MHSFWGVLSSQLCRSQSLCIECSDFDGFYKQKTEAPAELNIYSLLIFNYAIYNTKLQYLHTVARLLICQILCLTTSSLTLASLLTN